MRKSIQQILEEQVDILNRGINDFILFIKNHIFI
jgi:hypothetical protein